MNKCKQLTESVHCNMFLPKNKQNTELKFQFAIRLNDVAKLPWADYNGSKSSQNSFHIRLLFSAEMRRQESPFCHASNVNDFGKVEMSYLGDISVFNWTKC